MMRIPRQADVEALAAALATYPPPLRDRISDVDFMVGVDPVFVGLHAWVKRGDRSYNNVAHFAGVMHQARLHRSHRHPTIVVPNRRSLTIPVLVHELAHALHETVEWEHRAQPVSRYAQNNHWEAFAEAVTSWLIPGYARRPSEETIAFLEGL